MDQIERTPDEEPSLPSKLTRELRRRARRFLLWLIRLRGSPRAIAAGLALGTVVAFTPTIGFQMVLAVALATLVGANRPAALVPTWLTNPVTIPPVYAFTYTLGRYFWKGPEPAEVARAVALAAGQLRTLDFLAFREQLDLFLGLGLDVFVAMWIGGLLVGLVGAALVYPVTLRMVVRLRARRRRRGRRRGIRKRSRTR